MATGKEILPDPSIEESPDKSWRQLVSWHLFVLLTVIAFFGTIRWRLADMPLERDEGEYAYAGQLILQGVPPYQLAYNMKLPGTYAAYAAILAAFGQTARGIHLGLLLVNAVSVLLLYLIVARLFGIPAGVIAGSSYALLSTLPAVLGFAAHATHFVVLTALIGIVLMLRAEETRRTAFFCWAGIAFGVTFLMKQPGIFLGAFALFYLAAQCWPRNKREWASWTKHMGIFVLAGALPFALTCVVLYRAGVFGNFWFWTFVYARQYAIALPLRESWSELAPKVGRLLSLMVCLALLAVIGIVRSLGKSGIRRRDGVFVFGLLVFSIVAVCPGLYFRPHYFILMMPALAIIIAVVVVSTVRLVAEHSASRWLHVLPVLLFAAAFAFAIYRNADFYFKMTPVQASRFCYPDGPFVDVVPIADYLRQHTAPSDTIVVFGSEPEIYFYAQRHSATGYIYVYSLMEDQAYWSEMQKQMMREVEAKRPLDVVFVDLQDSWLHNPGSPQAVAFDAWMKKYISEGFDEVEKVEFAVPESRYSSGDEARRHYHRGHAIYILKRKN